MSSQKQVFKYVVLGILGWVLASVLALGFEGGLYPLRAVGAVENVSEFTLVAQGEKPEPDVGAAGVPGRGGPNGEGNGLRAFEEVTAGLEKQEGLFTVYSDLENGKLYLALTPEQLDRNYLLMASIESGVGEAGLFRGWPLNDLLVQFREARNNRLQVVVPNTFITNPEGQDWQRRLLESSFSDSAILSLKVLSIDPKSQAKLIDLSKLVMERDIANVNDALSSATEDYSRNTELSQIDAVNVFEKNLELATTVGFTSSGDSGSFSFASLFGFSMQGLPDSRGFSLGIRYSLSALPEGNGYEPRLADERVGYFISAYRAPLQIGRTDPFVRVIHRWHLEKQNPQASYSPPKEPIVFWLENTVPPAYRDDIKAGILMWNDAFAQAGFQDAIEVRQMPDNADWDPADVRYNVIRWSDSLGSRVAGIGPSRVNPLTGEILDADIILDANIIRSLQEQYRTRGLEATPETEAYLQMCAQQSQDLYLQWQALQIVGPQGPNMVRQGLVSQQLGHSWPSQSYCTHYIGTQQVAFGPLALQEMSGLARASTGVTLRSQLDKYLHQYLVMLTAHEVGHTLGLRHNYAGSGLLAPSQLNDESITSTSGLASSVMDYLPPNIAPPGTEQGDFYPTRLGAYDIWAIQYGYQDVATTSVLANAPGSGADQRQTLQEIAARGDAAELVYVTDEDVFDQIDPEVSPWDLSSDPLQFAQWQMDNAQAVWQRLNRFSVSRNEGFGGLRKRVDLLFRYFDNNTATLTNYVGGQRFRRVSPWESTDRTPLQPIPVDKQREALNALNEKVFAADAFQFSADLLNQLPPDRWMHRGTRLVVAPLDYPIYEQVLEVQAIALSNLLSATRLARVRDLEYKSTAPDVMTIAEILNTTYRGIWSEVAATSEASQNLSSLRRGLQRHHLNILSNLASRRGGDAIASSQSFLDFVALALTIGAPEDARVLARYQLRDIYNDVNRALRRYGSGMEITTRAHWEEVRDRIARILDA